MDQNRWWLAIPFALGLMIANIIISVLYVVVYSYLIDPGHEEAYYQAYAQVAAPYSSIIAGIPRMFRQGDGSAASFQRATASKRHCSCGWCIF